MNGQNGSQRLPSSSFTSPDTGGGNVGVTELVKSNPWLRDMAADPGQAAQAGLLSLQQNSSAPVTASHIPSAQFNLSRSTAAPGGQSRSPFPSEFPYPNRMYQRFLNVSALGPMAGASGELNQSAKLPTDTSIANQNRLLVPAVTSSNDSSNSAAYGQMSQNHVKSFPSSADVEISAKRMKMTKLEDRKLLPSQPMHVTAPQHVQPMSGPHRPEYFHRGSVIQLGERRLRRIEDLQTSDFEYSASVSPDLSLDSSTVLKISEDLSRGTAFLTFSVGDHHHKPVSGSRL